jgi:hypothetical protein
MINDEFTKRVLKMSPQYFHKNLIYKVLENSSFIIHTSSLQNCVVIFTNENPHKPVLHRFFAAFLMAAKNKFSA